MPMIRVNSIIINLEAIAHVELEFDDGQGDPAVRIGFVNDLARDEVDAGEAAANNGLIFRDAEARALRLYFRQISIAIMSMYGRDNNPF